VVTTSLLRDPPLTSGVWYTHPVQTAPVNWLAFVIAGGLITGLFFIVAVLVLGCMESAKSLARARAERNV
jgi:hypothetical protein